MRHLSPLRLVLLALSLLAAGTVHAQQSAGTTDGGMYAQEAEGTVSAGEPSPNASGLPRQAPPPRTLRAHWHVYGAFAIAWLLVFGYALSLGRRFGVLDRELRQLEGRHGA